MKLAFSGCDEVQPPLYVDITSKSTLNEPYTINFTPSGRGAQG